MINQGLFSSNTDQWSTPQNFFDKMNEEFNFDLDVCADEFNHKCDRYFTREMNALEKVWNGVCWMNPPYGREIGKWIEKAYRESLKGNIVVCLIPARTDTRYWHEWIFGKGEIRFIKGRLKFGDSENSAPFPSAVIVYGENYNGVITI